MPSQSNKWAFSERLDISLYSSEQNKTVDTRDMPRFVSSVPLIVRDKFLFWLTWKAIKIKKKTAPIARGATYRQGYQLNVT